MRQGHFVEGLSNIARFLDGVKTVEQRGAAEASWLLVTGEPGFGKTKTLNWFAAQNPSVHVRAKADWTPNWMLSDFSAALGLKTPRRTEDLFNAVLAEILKLQNHRDGFHVIVDEIDHAARSIRVLETLRDLTDTAEVPLIAGGHKGVSGALKRYPQIYSRIARVVEFSPASFDDVAAMCTTLSDVKVSKDMVAEIQARTQGRLRECMNAIARVEAFGRKSRETVTVESYGKRPLLSDERDRSREAQS